MPVRFQVGIEPCEIIQTRRRDMTVCNVHIVTLHNKFLRVGNTCIQYKIWSATNETYIKYASKNKQEG